MQLLKLMKLLLRNDGVHLYWLFDVPRLLVTYRTPYSCGKQAQQAVPGNVYYPIHLEWKYIDREAGRQRCQKKSRMKKCLVIYWYTLLYSIANYSSGIRHYDPKPPKYTQSLWEDGTSLLPLFQNEVCPVPLQPANLSTKFGLSMKDFCDKWHCGLSPQIQTPYTHVTER